MSIIQDLNAAFPCLERLTVKEKYSTFDLESKFQVSQALNLREDLLTKFFEQLNDKTESDTWTISLSEENTNPIFFDLKNETTTSFIENLMELDNFSDHNSLNLKLHIEKKCVFGSIKIYNLPSFANFVKDLGTLQFLKIINADLHKHKTLYFRMVDEEKILFFSRNIYFGSDERASSNANYSPVDLRSREVCYFANQAEYPYSPKHFNLIKQENAPSEILNKLVRLTYIFSIVNIFDVTSIKENILSYKLNGYKTIEGTIDVDNAEITPNSVITYFKICEWIYSDSSNFTEKIGIARNIISIYLEGDSLEISEKSFFSIKSGFKIYLQENLNRYLEIRSTINEQLENISRNANNSIEKYLDNYQKSSITFVSFFISTLVITVLSTGQFRDAFTKDATILALALVAISLLYLVFSMWSLNAEKERLKIRYQNLKSRFRDLLVDEDINKILQEDKEFEDEIRFIESRASKYTILWICTVLIVLIAILSLSDYINWNSIASFLGAMF